MRFNSLIVLASLGLACNQAVETVNKRDATALLPAGTGGAADASPDQPASNEGPDALVVNEVVEFNALSLTIAENFDHLGAESFSSFQLVSKIVVV